MTAGADSFNLLLLRSLVNRAVMRPSDLVFCRTVALEAWDEGLHQETLDCLDALPELSNEYPEDSRGEILDLYQWYAHFHNEFGNHSRAASIQENTVEIYEEVFGQVHDETISALRSLAYFERAAGCSGAAIETLDAAIQRHIQLHTSEDRDLFEMRLDLAIVNEDCGFSGEAIDILDQLQWRCSDVLGPTDPLTLLVRHWLGMTLGIATPEGARIFKAATDDAEQFLPPDHPYREAIAENNDYMDAVKRAMQALARKMKRKRPSQPPQ